MMKLKTAVISSLLLAAGCAQTQNGTPSVNLSMASLLNSAGLTKPATPVANQTATQQDQIIGMQTDNTPLVGTPIAQTNLLDFFDNNPNAVASVTIKNIQRNDCWLADATLWYSSTKSETVRDVKICKSADPSDAGKTAYNYYLFTHQTNTMGKTSGTTRTAGPVPPSSAVPGNIATQNSVKEFMGAFITHTNWQPTVGKITLWVVSSS